jgi:mannose-6-phosphate isomerase-like protein (cupin superfamily)
MLLLAACLVPLPVLAQTAAPPIKLFSSASDVQTLIAQARAEHKSGNTVKIIANTPGYPVQLEYRTSTTGPSIHPAQDELIEVIGGGCTLITGGTLAGAAIEGGTPRKVTKGDYVLVPANTPHQYTEIQGELITVAVHYPAHQP